MLCDACKLATVGGQSRVHAYDSMNHHQTFVAFHEAKRHGCSICSRLWARLCTECGFVPSMEEGIKISSSFETSSFADKKLVMWKFCIRTNTRTRSYDLNFDLLRDENGGYDEECEARTVNAFATPDHKQMLQDIGHEIAPNTDSVLTLKLVQHWLSNCQANHPGCKRDADLHCPLPLRVIDVGTTGESSVRLFVSESSFQDGTYMTLSHCWGNSNIMKLTVENEKSLRVGFAIQDLPKTFRQAIQFTRALSVKYLWIDSLCILQDSIDDWRHQSALMGEIYRNCFCNIAATSSPNSDGGIFVEREPNLVKPLNLPIKWRWNPDESACQERYYLWDSRLWDTCLRDAPLNRRGWVLQERLLAPRVLYFSKFVFWECSTMTACEIMPTREPTLQGVENFYTRLIQTIEDLPAKEHDPTDHVEALTKSAHDAWWELVSKYSSCELTKDADILVAISGIATIMEMALKDQYVGGLWRSTLLTDLLWRAREEGHRPFPFRAPT